MGKVDFDEYIKKQNAIADPDDYIDWEREKKEWLTHLDRFYDRIEEFVREYKERGDVTLEYQEKSINEEGIGEYSVRKLKMKIRNNDVTFDPVGTNVIGAKGRVDMTGCAGSVLFVLVDKDRSNLLTKIKIQIDDKRQETEREPKTPSSEWVWKIATPPPYMECLDLNEDSFFDAVMEIINA